jgi:hypothetical protein
VLLPPSGAEKCSSRTRARVISVISALKYTRDAIIAVGTRDTGAGLRLTVWKLDPDHCEVVLPGWPKTIANWTAKPALAGMTSLGAAVDVDEDGNIVVAGNFIVGGKPQSYVALLNPAGARLWEKEGQVGDEVAGVAAATAQFKNRVFVVGSQRTSDVPVRTDGAVWVYIATASRCLSSRRPHSKRRSPRRVRSGRENEPRASGCGPSTIQPGTGNALAVGEREFMPTGFRCLQPGLRGPGPSARRGRGHAMDIRWAPHFVTMQCARSKSAATRSWPGAGPATSHPNAKPQPIMFWLETDKYRSIAIPQLGATQIYGIACDREEKIVSAATRLSGSPDAQVFTVTGLFDPPTWYETGAVGDDGAGAVACDWRGFCGWGGYRTSNGKPTRGACPSPVATQSNPAGRSRRRGRRGGPRAPRRTGA